jgi:hypothetical protein
MCQYLYWLYPFAAGYGTIMEKAVMIMEHRLMTEHEKADIYMQSLKLKKEGKTAEAVAMKRAIPLPA